MGFTASDNPPVSKCSNKSKVNEGSFHVIGELFIKFTQVVLTWVFVVSPSVWPLLNVELSRTLFSWCFLFSNISSVKKEI